MSLLKRISKITGLALAMALGGGAVGAQTVDHVYASNVRGWTVYSVEHNGGFDFCYADMLNSTRLAFDGRQWLVGQNSNGLSGPGFVSVGKADADVFWERVDDIWSVAFITHGMLDQIKRGSTLTIEIGGTIWDHPLTGSTAAALKVQECANNGGVLPVAKPTAPAPRVAAPIESDAHRMGAGCPVLGTVKSMGNGGPTTVDFWITQNPNRGAVSIYWLDGNGMPVEMPLPNDQGHLNLNSTVGHHFIAKDFGGTCYGGVMTAGPGGSVFHIQ